MPREKRVLRSIEIPDGNRCVDIFIRPDATYGFEEYRRDVEDRAGWFPIGNFSTLVYESELSATEDATMEVPWLKEFIQKG